jgi:hypothetical protein
MSVSCDLNLSRIDLRSERDRSLEYAVTLVFLWEMLLSLANESSKNSSSRTRRFVDSADFVKTSASLMPWEWMRWNSINGFLEASQTIMCSCITMCEQCNKQTETIPYRQCGWHAEAFCYQSRIEIT